MILVIFDFTIVNPRNFIIIFTVKKPMRLVFSSIQIRTDTRNCSSFVPRCTRFVKSGSNITDTTTFDSIPRFFFAAKRAILSLLPSSSYFSEKNIGRMRAACILFHRKKKKKASDTRCSPFNCTSRCLLFMLLFCIRHQ